MQCQGCAEALMKLKWSRRYTRWFYGCAKYPACSHTFDAEQKTGAPLPGSDGRPVPGDHFKASDWTSGHPEEASKTAIPGRAFWRHVLDDTYLSEPLPVMPEAFPDNVIVPTRRRPAPKSVVPPQPDRASRLRIRFVDLE